MLGYYTNLFRNQKFPGRNFWEYWLKNWLKNMLLPRRNTLVDSIVPRKASTSTATKTKKNGNCVLLKAAKMKPFILARNVRETFVDPVFQMKPDYVICVSNKIKK